MNAAGSFQRLAGAGAIWVGLVIASGMIGTIGLASILEWAQTDLDRALTAWRVVSLITECIGGGNELVGGLWFLLLSLVALRAGMFPQGANYFGCLVRAAGVATVYPAELITSVFGLCQILWFIWIGVLLLREANAPENETAAVHQNRLGYNSRRRINAP